MASLSKASQQKRELYYKNPEKYREIQRNYYQRNQERGLLSGAKARSKKRGLEFNLELSDIVIPEFCPILDIPLIRNHNGGKPSKNSPSLDRVDSALGYIKGNVQVISYFANTMKQDATEEELKRFASWVVVNYV